MDQEELQEQNESQESETKEKKSSGSKTSMIIFIVLFLLSMGLNVFLFFRYVKRAVALEQEYTEIKALLDESDLRADSLQKELDETIAQFQQKLDEDYAMESELRNSLEEKVVELERAKVKISGLIASGGQSGPGSTKSLLQAKKELEELKKSNAAYLSELDELKKLYAITQNAADNYSGQADQYKSVSDSLYDVNSTLNKKLAKAGTLRIANLQIQPYQDKRDKSIETDKASKVSKLKIQFSVIPTELTQKEDKTVYMRIIGTGGEVLSDNVKQLADINSVISDSMTISYDGKEKIITFYYKQNAEYKKGRHTLEMVHDGQLIDRRSFLLD